MKTFLALLLLIPSLSWGEYESNQTKPQTFSDVISEERIGRLNCKHSIKTDMRSNDRDFEVFCIFDNVKYKYISDYGVVMWSSNEEIKKAISGLEQCYPLMDRDGYEMNCSRGFKLFEGNMFVGDDEYTIMNKDKVHELINWLKDVKSIYNIIPHLKMNLAYRELEQRDINSIDTYWYLTNRCGGLFLEDYLNKKDTGEKDADKSFNMFEQFIQAAMGFNVNTGKISDEEITEIIVQSITQYSDLYRDMLGQNLTNSEQAFLNQWIKYDKIFCSDWIEDFVKKMKKAGRWS